MVSCACGGDQDVPGEVGEYASFSLTRIKMTGELGPRREVPTAMEIDACKFRKPVRVPCNGDPRALSSAAGWPSVARPYTRGCRSLRTHPYCLPDCLLAHLPCR